MKLNTTKKIVTAFAIALLAAAAWCQDLSIEQSDSYDSDSTPIQKTEPKVKKTVSSLIIGDTPIELGEGTLFEYNMFNTGVVQNDVSYLYYPKNEAVVLAVDSSMSKYYIFLDKNDRAVCRAAYKQYLADFSAHVLNKNGNKTYNAYGEFAGEFRQGMIGTGTVTKPKVSVGYKFVKNAPYFCLTLWPAELESFMPGADVDSGDGSSKMTYFFTKKQIGELVKSLDEEKISSLVSEQIEVPEAQDEY